ncbi:MAG: cytochrome c [Hydrogenibacillus schlegelii]|nr:cytochrome c [Hydrogenibacillus schlegelii]
MTRKPFYFLMLGGTVLLLLLVFFVYLPTKGKGPAAEGETAANFDPQAAFQQSCASCHGQDLKGTPAAPSLVGLNLSVDEVVDIITNGRKGSMGVMPPGMFNGSDAEKKALAEWVLSHK